MQYKYRDLDKMQSDILKLIYKVKQWIGYKEYYPTLRKQLLEIGRNWKKILNGIKINNKIPKVLTELIPKKVIEIMRELEEQIESLKNDVETVRLIEMTVVHNSY